MTPVERLKVLRLTGEEVVGALSDSNPADIHFQSAHQIADAQYDKLLRGLAEIINVQIWSKTPNKEAMIIAGRQVGKQLTTMAATSKLFGYLSALEDTELMLRQALEEPTTEPSD